MLGPRSLPLICFRSLQAEQHRCASKFLLPPLSSSAALCTSRSILVGSCLSYANPCPITPNFYSYPFLIYGIPLGLTSHGTFFFFFPPLHCLFVAFSLVLFCFQRYFSGSSPSCLEVICAAVQSSGFQRPQTFPSFSAFLLLAVILGNNLTDMASSQPPINVNLCD